MNNEIEKPPPQYKVAIEKFYPAFKSAGPYVAVGLLAGLILIVLGYLYEHNGGYKILALLLEHIGTGFIVSALAVFFYEWGAHIKHAMDLSKELVKGINNLHDIQKINVLSGRMVGFLERKKDDNAAHLNEALDFMLSTEEPCEPPLSHLKEKLLSIAESVGEIDRNKNWASKQYVEFINYLLENVVEQNAQTLVHISKINEQGEFPFAVPPNGAEMADEILATHMRALDVGDSYDVLSHVTAWRYLKNFHDETKKAIRERGVTVRRIFNFRIKYADELSVEEMRNVLTQHFKAMEDLADQSKFPRYHVKVLRQAELNKTISARFIDHISSSHFGIFIKKIDRDNVSKIRVKVHSADLSDMRLVRHEKAFKDDIQLFDEAWRIGTDLSPEIINEIINEWEARKKLKQIDEKTETNEETKPEEPSTPAEKK
jgi:hypothetical protein